MSPDMAGGRGVIYLSVGWTSLPSLLRHSVFGGGSWYLRSRMSSKSSRRLLRLFRVKPVDLASIADLPIGPYSTDGSMRQALSRLEARDLDPLFAWFAERYRPTIEAPRFLGTALARDISAWSLDAYYADLWSRAQQFDRVVFVGSSVWHRILLEDRAKGRRVVGAFGRGLALAGSLAVRTSLRRKRSTVEGSAISNVRRESDGAELHQNGSPADLARTVLYILNQGTSYGALYAYDHVFSDDESSPMHPTNVIVMARTGGPRNAEGIQDAYPDAGSRRDQFRSAVRACVGAIRVFGLRYEWRYVWFLAKFCASVDGQRAELITRYPSVRMAVLAYEVQVPVQLVLALESLGIRTVAFNERPLSVLQEIQPFAVSTLLTASPYFSRSALLSRSVFVRDPVPVGQWRTDLLIQYRAGQAHELVSEAHRNGRRFVVALPYDAHAGTDWNGNPLATAAYSVSHFLGGMIDLAEARPDLQVVLRGKSDNWLEDERFADIALRLEKVENISVSRDYERLNESYRLCANADLIIAKYTSLVDEALALGIPCVVHDFIPNATGVTQGIAKHLPDGVWAENHEQLTERIDFALRDGGTAFRGWWEDYRVAVYGDYNDGLVRERARKVLEGLA